MTDLARRLVEPGVLSRVNVDVVPSVAGRLDLGFTRVAQLAAEGGIDRRVTNQAVRHLRVVRRSSQITFGQAAMTCSTRVLRFQMLPYLGAWRQIASTVNRCSQSRRHVSQGQVLQVAETERPFGIPELVSRIATVMP